MFLLLVFSAARLSDNQNEQSFHLPWYSGGIAESSSLFPQKKDLLMNDTIYYVCIDFGTTNSSVAVDVNGNTRGINIPAHGPQLPSAVFQPPGEAPVIGANATRMAYKNPQFYFTLFKRLLPNVPDEPIDGSDGPTPKQLMTSVIQHLLSVAYKAEPQIKLHADGLKPREGVVFVLTHPVGYGTQLQDVYREAARSAGIEIDAFVTEPVAASKRLVNENHRQIRSGDFVLLVDFGGGTLDLTLQKTDGATLNTVVSGGDALLGGADLTAAIFCHFAEKLDMPWLAGCFTAEHGLDLSNPALKTPAKRKLALSLWQAAEEAKQQISTEATARVLFDSADGPEELVLTGDEFDRITKPIWTRFIAATKAIIDGSALFWSDIKHIALAGGSAWARGALEHLATATERDTAEIMVSTDSHHAIAIGGALFVRDDGDSDTNLSRGFGIRLRQSEHGSGHVNNFLLGTDTVIPAGRKTIQGHGQYLVSNGGATRFGIQFVEARSGAIAAQPQNGISSLLDDQEIVQLQRVMVEVDVPRGRHDVTITVTIDLGVTYYHLGFPGLPHVESVTGRLTSELSPSSEELQSQPVDLFLLMDTSTSMEGEKLDEAKLALTAVLDETEHADIRYCLVSFGSRTGVVSPLGTSSDEIRLELQDLEANAATPMTKAFNCATDQLRRHSRPEARLVSVLLTDGQPSNPVDAMDAAEVHKERAELICVGVGDDVDELYLREMATEHQYFPAEDADQISIVFESVIELILKQE